MVLCLDVEVINLCSCKYIVLIIPPLLVEVCPIRMSNPKTIFISWIKTIQTTVLSHKPRLKYKITDEPKLFLLRGSNPCTKYPHLTIGIGLRRFQQIDDALEKFIYLTTFKIVIILQPTRRTKPSMKKPWL